MLRNVGKALRIISDETKDNIAIVFDGPTIIHKLDLEKLKLVKEALKEIGSTRIGKYITDKPLTQNGSQFLSSIGFREEIVGSDVDIHVTLSSLSYLNDKNIQIVGIATTDENLFPLFSQIKKSKKLLILTYKENITPTIESFADYILELDYF